MTSFIAAPFISLITWDQEESGIQNPVKHLIWSTLQRNLMAKNLRCLIIDGKWKTTDYSDAYTPVKGNKKTSGQGADADAQD